MTDGAGKFFVGLWGGVTILVACFVGELRRGDLAIERGRAHDEGARHGATVGQAAAPEHVGGYVPKLHSRGDVNHADFTLWDAGASEIRYVGLDFGRVTYRTVVNADLAGPEGVDVHCGGVRKITVSCEPADAGAKISRGAATP